MVKKDMEIVQVCFNTLDPHQREQYKRVASFPNKSGYIKRLIQRDMERDSVTAVHTARSEHKDLEDFNADGFI